MCACNVEKLHSVLFSAKNFEEIQAIIQTGRPRIIYFILCDRSCSEKLKKNTIVNLQ